MSFDDDEFTLDEAWGEDGEDGGDRANDTLRAENERLRAALEDGASIHGKNAWHPDTKYPTPLAREWHNGYITCAATVSLKATAALDPVQKAEDDRLWRLGSNGTDSEWWAATGHCGGCGTVASSCDCDGSCGCWEDHGPPLNPWRSLPAQVAELTAECDRLRAALAAAVPAPDEDSRERDCSWLCMEHLHHEDCPNAPAPAVPGEDDRKVCQVRRVDFAAGEPLGICGRYWPCSLHPAPAAPGSDTEGTAQR